MKKTLILSTLTSLFLSLTSVSIAQTEDYSDNNNLLQPNTEGEFQKNEIDSTGESTFGSGFDPMQIIHNSNFRRSRNGAEFAEDTQNSLNNAAEEFKKQQRQRLLEQPQNSDSQGIPSNNDNL